MWLSAMCAIVMDYPQINYCISSDTRNMLLNVIML